jgi:hypothetical protein
MLRYGHSWTPCPSLATQSAHALLVCFLAPCVLVIVQPLVTASYIPLSHSSDRMKLWEFMLNGGRVGFAFFPAGTAPLACARLLRHDALFASLTVSRFLASLSVAGSSGVYSQLEQSREEQEGAAGA